jgi:hypothetical protein
MDFINNGVSATNPSGEAPGAGDYSFLKIIEAIVAKNREK